MNNNRMDAIPIESVKINPRDYIQLIEYEFTTMFEFTRRLRAYFALNDGPKSFYFDFDAWKHAKQLSKYVDELY